MYLLRSIIEVILSNAPSISSRVESTRIKLFCLRTPPISIIVLARLSASVPAYFSVSRPSPPLLEATYSAYRSIAAPEAPFDSAAKMLPPHIIKSRNKTALFFLDFIVHLLYDRLLYFLRSRSSVIFVFFGRYLEKSALMDIFLLSKESTASTIPLTVKGLSPVISKNRSKDGASSS